MTIVVYFLNTDGTAEAVHFTSKELSPALTCCEILRKQGMRHVSLSSELEGSVGKQGVTAVEDGKTPDGVTYDWKKRRQ